MDRAARQARALLQPIVTNYMSTSAKSILEASCADDYDPNSMSVVRAREFIAQFLSPVSGVLRVPLRDALGRVLARTRLAAQRACTHQLRWTAGR
jgi:hypothetical protein